MAWPFAALGELKPRPPNGLRKKRAGKGAGGGGVVESVELGEDGRRAPGADAPKDSPRRPNIRQG
jgi:hypothetical protein